MLADENIGVTDQNGTVVASAAWVAPALSARRQVASDADVYMSLPVLRHEQARYLIISRVRVRLQVVGDEELLHRQESHAIGRRKLLEQHAPPSREVDTLEAGRNFSTAIGKHLLPFCAP